MHSSILLVLLVASVACSLPVFCPDGYKDIGDGYCYGIRLGNKISRTIAYQKCKAEGAELAVIDNMFTNVAISSSLPAFNFIWFGMTCTDVNTCYGDNGDALSFNNFYLTTNMSAGPFAYVDNLGMWGVGDYDTLADGYVCRYESNRMGCPYGYTGIEDRCYMPIISPYNAMDADQICRKSGGRLTSIKSQQHNSYVHWLLHQQTNTSMAHIGLMASNAVSVNWTDSSVQTYSNLVYYNPEVGQCGAMSMTNPIFPAGTWQSVDCDDKLPSVCGADRLVNFTTPFTGKLPNTCLTTYFITNSTSGTLTSPGYPMNANLVNRCQIVLSAPYGYKIIATSNDTNISDGYLYVCDKYTSNVKCQRNPTTFTSYTGLLYVEFNSGRASSKWSLNYRTEHM